MATATCVLGHENDLGPIPPDAGVVRWECVECGEVGEVGTPAHVTAQSQGITATDRVIDGEVVHHVTDGDVALPQEGE